MNKMIIKEIESGNLYEVFSVDHNSFRGWKLKKDGTRNLKQKYSTSIYKSNAEVIQDRKCLVCKKDMGDTLNYIGTREGVTHTDCYKD